MLNKIDRRRRGNRVKRIKIPSINNNRRCRRENSAINLHRINKIHRRDANSVNDNIRNRLINRRFHRIPVNNRSNRSITNTNNNNNRNNSNHRGVN
jgi:hypothetical protein